MSMFLEAFNKLMKQEGGKVNDPVDTGGKTNMGITQRAWNAFMATLPQSQMPKDVFDINASHANTFYLTEYWSPLHCSQINSQPLAEALFSIAVNQGAGTAAKRLQAVVGVTEDGSIGPKTIEAINAMDANELLNKFLDATQAYYDRIVERDSTQSRFANGWKNRIDGLRMIA